jgi:hypothetical protein
VIQLLRSIGAVLVKVRRDDGHSERHRSFRATFRHFRKPLGDDRDESFKGEGLKEMAGARHVVSTIASP